jgi:hypothetical protein
MLQKLGAFVGVAALLVGVSFGAAAQGGVKIGTLKCNVGSGWGFVLGSTKDLKCIFSPNGAAERYGGTVQKFGVDIGYTQSGVIIWAVFAPTTDLKPGALRGTYVGASAEVSAGMGLGANVLIGGGSSIALQPLSIQGQEGFNVAAGIGSIQLESAPQ